MLNVYSIASPKKIDKVIRDQFLRFKRPIELTKTIKNIIPKMATNNLKWDIIKPIGSNPSDDDCEPWISFMGNIVFIKMFCIMFISNVKPENIIRIQANTVTNVDLF